MQKLCKPKGVALSKSIALFTRDLRIHDNPVLAAAGPDVVPMFVLDPAFARDGFTSDYRLSFLHECLHDLDKSLRELGSYLTVRRGDTVREVCRIVEETGAAQVHVAADVSALSRRRETKLREALADIRCELVVHDEVHTVVAPGRIEPTGKGHYAVFTPYWRRWAETPVRPLAKMPSKLRKPSTESDKLPELRSHDRMAGGESAGRNRMDEWLHDGLADYEKMRDIMAEDKTSRLSPYLHFGCVSAAELTVRCCREPEGEPFVRQLAWRDFHHQVLASDPRLATRDYRPGRAEWVDDPDARDAWSAGMTGYPLVDAGMRELQATGWMHNRTRMLVGSFLTKNLGQDWRFGATTFFHQLLDGDIANNCMNWQWVAGTGLDTRPARRLSPIRQAERFDPDAAYIRRWVPELASLPVPFALQPWKMPAAKRRTVNYPDPIVPPPGSKNG